MLMIKFTKQRIAITKNRRLKKYQVLEILQLCQSNEVPFHAIAAFYKVSYSTVYGISCGYRWKNLTKVIAPTRISSEVSQNATLTPKKVKSIRNKWNKGISQNSLARAYKISQPVVFDIVHRRTYRSVGN